MHLLCLCALHTSFLLDQHHHQDSASALPRVQNHQYWLVILGEGRFHLSQSLNQRPPVSVHTCVHMHIQPPCTHFPSARKGFYKKGPTLKVCICSVGWFWKIPYAWAFQNFSCVLSFSVTVNFKLLYLILHLYGLLYILFVSDFFSIYCNTFLNSGVVHKWRKCCLAPFRKSVKAISFQTGLLYCFNAYRLFWWFSRFFWSISFQIC